MKKIAGWLAAISMIVFVTAWGIGGLMIFNHEFENNAWAYVALISIVILLCSIICLKTIRCPYCGKLKQTFGKYCPYCGKEIN